MFVILVWPSCCFRWRAAVLAKYRVNGDLTFVTSLLFETGDVHPLARHNQNATLYSAELVLDVQQIVGQTLVPNDARGSCINAKQIVS